MRSKKTKTNEYSLLEGKAITQVGLLAEGGGFRVYVAWEWENMAQRGFFGIIKSDKIYGSKTITHEIISEVADYGHDITDTPEAKSLFSNLFK